jgi:hypothetical protein
MKFAVGKRRSLGVLVVGLTILLLSVDLAPTTQLASSTAVPQFVQARVQMISGTSLNIPYSSSVGDGDLLVGVFRTASGTSVSDNLNGAWTQAGSSGVNSLWYLANAKAGATTVSVAATTSGPVRADIAEYSGVAANNALAGASCNGASPTGNAVTTGNTASVNSGDLAFIGMGAFTNPISVTAGISDGASATLRNQQTGSQGTEAIEDVTRTASGAQNGSFHLSGGAGWAACIAVFHPATNAAPTPTPGLTPINNVPCIVTINGVQVHGTCSGTFKPGSTSTPTPTPTAHPTPTPTASPTSTPKPTPTPTPSPTLCTITLSPGADIASAESGAAAGAVICLKPGAYTSPEFTTSHGTISAPITVTSADRSNPAVLNGRFAVLYAANDLNITHLKFTWQSSADDTVVMTGDHINFSYNDVSGNGRTICINPTAWAGVGFTNSIIDHNLVHDCMGDTIHTQGIYFGPGSNNDVVSNNWCWNVAARCYQVRSGSNNIWRNNVADQANWGFLFGDLTPTNNNAYDNIVGPDVTHLGTCCYSYGGSVIVSLLSGGSGNSFHDSCVPAAPYQETGTVSAYNNTIVNVQFVDAAHHNYNLTSASVNDPCRNYGVQGGNPGP